MGMVYSLFLSMAFMIPGGWFITARAYQESLPDGHRHCVSSATGVLGMISLTGSMCRGIVAPSFSWCECDGVRRPHVSRE